MNAFEIHLCVPSNTLARIPSRSFADAARASPNDSPKSIPCAFCS